MKKLTLAILASLFLTGSLFSVCPGKEKRSEAFCPGKEKRFEAVCPGKEK